MKETAAQRKERLAKEEAELQKKRREEHLPRIMSILHRATFLNWSIIIHHNGFSIIEPNESPIYITPYYDSTENDWWALECIEGRLDKVEAEQAEEARLQNIKQEVLARLNDDERKALGFR